MIKKVNYYFLFLILILFFISIFSLSIGDSQLSFFQTICSLFGQSGQFNSLIVQDIRLPRIIVAILGSGALGISGLLLQTLTANPLADSSILGVNTGAGFIVTLLIITTPFGESLTFKFIPILAIVGAYFIILILYYLSLNKDKKINTYKLIITGVAISSMLSGLMISLTGNINRYKMTYIINWLNGQINGDNWETITLIVPILIILIVISYSNWLPFNIMQLNDDSVKSIGVNLNFKRQLILFLSTSLSALSIVMIGNISFIGLLSTHISRVLVGQNYKLLIPSTLLIGALILLISDTITRVFLVGTTIPTGLIVTLIGSPYFIFLLIQSKTFKLH